MTMGEAAKRLIELARGDRRMLSDKELAERDFEGFFRWLREKGIGNPYYFFSKGTWVLVRFQRLFNEYQREEEAKAQAEQKRAAIINLLEQDPDTGKGIVFTAVQMWTKEQRAELLTLLTPPPTVVQDVPEEVLPPGVVPEEADPSEVS